MTTQRVCL